LNTEELAVGTDHDTLRTRNFLLIHNVKNAETVQDARIDYVAVAIEGPGYRNDFSENIPHINRRPKTQGVPYQPPEKPANPLTCRIESTSKNLRRFAVVL
jgi:hypothetical protein